MITLIVKSGQVDVEDVLHNVEDWRLVGAAGDGWRRHGDEGKD